MIKHPHIFLTAEPIDGLRSVDEIRAAIRNGYARVLWEQLLADANAIRKAKPLLPGSRLPGRGPVQAGHANRDCSLCKEAGLRLRKSALAGLLTGDTDYRDVALRQIDALFDEDRWPDWRDMAHLQHPADLRTGSLGRDIALAYDWLYPMLSSAWRSSITAGLTRRAFKPFWESVAKNCFWVNGTNNWMTCIVGGLGIAAMALDADYPRSRELIEFSLSRLRGYLKNYGPDGEFNESVGYAGSTLAPVMYFMAHRYHTVGRDNILGRAPFTDFCRWYMYFTVPPGKIVDFGDSHSGAPPESTMFLAVAQAARDGILQEYYLQHGPEKPSRAVDLELLWMDESLKPVDPEGNMPQGRAFPAHSGNISSRTDWNSKCTACTVYAKAGHGAEGHGHHDAGQVCIDGYGERLIIDLGNPAPVYPADFFSENRYRYYNAGVAGHNVLMFGGREMCGRTEDRARIIDARFDDSKGGWWGVETTAMYIGARQVIRTAAHLFPGFVAVLDQAFLAQSEAVSLRWHTIDRAGPDHVGRFTVYGERAGVESRIVALDEARPSIERKEHKYKSPFDRCRLGDPLIQRRESYVEAKMQADRCRLLTLFAVHRQSEKIGRWTAAPNGWMIDTATGRANVAVTDTEMRMKAPAGTLVIPLVSYVS